MDGHTALLQGERKYSAIFSLCLFKNNHPEKTSGETSSSLHTHKKKSWEKKLQDLTSTYTAK